MPVLRFLIPLFAAVSFLSAADPALPAQGAAVFQNVCAQCHGAKGEGKVELKTPSIAGLPAWYAKIQLANFREGRRGHEASDPQAFMMAAIAKALQPEQIAAVTAHVEKMPLVIPTAKDREMAGTDVADGARLYYERCMECHRYNGSGEMTFGSAPLIGLQAWYLEDQLRKFKSGKRGTVKSDLNGAKMVQMTNQFIEDDQMLRNVVAYIMTLNPEPVAEETKPSAEVHQGSPFAEPKAGHSK
ncbi:MAG: c-type cytochrome [Prosthecobacter sp.]